MAYRVCQAYRVMCGSYMQLMTCTLPVAFYGGVFCFEMFAFDRLSQRRLELGRDPTRSMCLICKKGLSQSDVCLCSVGALIDSCSCCICHFVVRLIVQKRHNFYDRNQC